MPRRLTSALTLMLASALGGCRQTVILDQGSGNAGDGGFGDAFPWCQPVYPTVRSPDLMLVVDRSLAMQSAFGNGTRLTVAQQELQSLILTYQNVVRFGYEEFPGPSGSCPSGGCCAGELVPPLKSGALTAIVNAMHSCDVGLGVPCPLSPERPVAAALSRCRDVYMGFNQEGRNRYVLLIMGGEPSCSSDASMAESCDLARNEAVRLNNAGAKTAVVVIGGSELGSSKCIGDLALAGAASQGMQPPYYLARSPIDLSSAISDIGRVIAQDACELEVSPTVDPQDASLFFNGNELPRDQWDFDNGGRLKITLHRSACDMLLAGPVEIELRSPCVPRTSPPPPR